MDRYDLMSGTELKYEVKKRGLPLQQNKAAWKFRAVCRLDDKGKIPESLKFLTMGTKKMPDFYTLLTHVRNNSCLVGQDVPLESAQFSPSA